MKIEEGMRTSEQPRLQSRGGLEVKINADGKQPQEQHIGRSWKGKHSNMTQQKATTVIGSCVLDE
jgi:hypothetical protein